jgi:hypothetical protein
MAKSFNTLYSIETYPSMITVGDTKAGSYYEFCIALMMSALGLYLLHVIIFNEVHLCPKNEGIC